MCSCGKGGSFVRRHSCLQAWRDKCGFCLGLSSCFLVVFVFALLHTIVYYTPLTTLQEAESTGGQFDMALTPQLVHGSAEGILYTALKNTMMKNDLGLKFNYSSGRTSMAAVLAVADNRDNNITVELQLINSADEKWMGLGTKSSSLHLSPSPSPSPSRSLDPSLSLSIPLSIYIYIYMVAFN